MLAAPVTENEPKRLAALQRLELLDSEAEYAWNGIAQLAASILEMPIAAITLIGDDRQWFKAKVGLQFSETPRDISFCGHAIGQDGTFIIDDAYEDERFRDNPLVRGDPAIRFYAGHTINSPDGMAIGTVCIMDTKPRSLSTKQLEHLELLAGQVEYLTLIRSLGLDLREALKPALSSGQGNRDSVGDYLNKISKIQANVDPESPAGQALQSIANNTRRITEAANRASRVMLGS